MSSSPPFTLFNLPYVPLSIILNIMDRNEIIKVALTSKRVYKLSKMLRKRRMERVCVSICNYSSICFKTEEQMNPDLFRVSDSSKIQEDLKIEYLKIGDTVVKTQTETNENGCIHFYYEDHFIGIQTLSEIISDFFNVPIYSLSVTGDKNINDPRRAIDWIMSRQNSIAECSYHCEETSDEEVTYFLDTLKVTKELEVYAETSENFQYSFKYPMNLESLFVHPGPYPWLTLNNLIETNPRYLELFGPKFTNEEMNLFIRNWINGGNSNLQTVVMRLKLVDTEIIMNGIPAVWRETEEDLSYELGEDKTNEPDYFDYFFEIRNINGVVASIVADDGIDKFFFIYVWPDFKGQPYPLEPILQ